MLPGFHLAPSLFLLPSRDGLEKRRTLRLTDRQSMAFQSVTPVEGCHHQAPSAFDLLSFASSAIICFPPLSFRQVFSCERPREVGGGGGGGGRCSFTRAICPLDSISILPLYRSPSLFRFPLPAIHCIPCGYLPKIRDQRLTVFYIDNRWVRFCSIRPWF